MGVMVVILSRLLRLLAMLLRGTGRMVLSAACPPRCSACDQPLRRTAVFCSPCSATLCSVEGVRTLPAPCPVRIIAVGGYGGALAEALRRLKYQDRPDLARPLGALAARAVRRHQRRPQLVIPVPLHPSRLAHRGYNQSALLGAVVASQLRVPLLARALRRCRATKPQQGLDRSRRAANVEAAFAARAPDVVRGRRVLLIDDVVTTGATLAACARALYAAGARQVDALVVASAQLEAGAGSRTPTAARPWPRSGLGT